MSIELKHKSIYVGLLISQLLAVTCNAFLDIRYGYFSFEMSFWILLYGYSIRVAIKQNGVLTEYGTTRMRRLVIFGAVISIFIFIPTWGIFRAVVYILAILQVAYNCTTTTRRQLYLSILVSLVMVVFASSHYRADWTMLFYLIPYVIFVVATIVAEQINSKSDELRTRSLSAPILVGQTIAIITATLSILLLGFLLYLITPQKTIDQLNHKFGNPTAIGASLHTFEAGAGNQSYLPIQEPGMKNLLSNWPSPDEMRLAAKREGMPKWQADAINSLADISGNLSKGFTQTKKRFDSLWSAFKKWIEENLRQIIQVMILCLLLCLAIAFIFFTRELKVTTWIRSRFDYLYLGIFKIHCKQAYAISNYYYATERLFELQDIPRHRRMTVKEYFEEASNFNTEIKAELKMIARSFEDYRYGEKPYNKSELETLNSLYKKVYRTLSK